MAHILIIGGGVSGLSAGIYALLNGYNATICERHVVAGGNLTGWQRGNYHIDNCIHWLTGTNKNTERYRIWKDLGALGDDVPVYLGESLYTSELGGLKLSLYRDLEKTRAEMLSIAPDEKKEIDRLINAVKSVQKICGIAGKNHDEKASALQKITAAPSLAPYLRISTGELAERFTHPLLRQFMSCFIGADFAAVAFLVVFSTFCGDDGGIPEGGSKAMAERIACRFEELGGCLLLGKTAKKVNIKDGKAVSVAFADGDVLDCDYVICATDTKTAFDELLGIPMPTAIKKEYDDNRFVRFSSYHTAFSCKTDKIPFLGDYIFPLKKAEQDVLGVKYLVLREFTHEKTYAPKGETVLQTLGFCNQWQAKEFIDLKKLPKAYKNRKIELAKATEEIIVKKFPQLKEKISCIDVWTPATYQRYYGEEIGAYMSFIFPKKHLPKTHSAKVKGLDNVFIASQWQRSPGGLPTAAEMGKNTIECIVKQEARAPFPWLFPVFNQKQTKQTKKV